MIKSRSRESLIVIIVLSIFFLQGCANIHFGLSLPHSQIIDNPSISEFYGNVYYEDPTKKPINSFTIKALWGAPNEVNIREDNSIVWTYKKKGYDDKYHWSWRGVHFIIIILPIPLMLPIDTEEISLVIENDIVKKAYIDGSYDFNIGYAIVPNWGCSGNAPFCTFATLKTEIDKNFISEPKSRDLIKQPIENDTFMLCNNAHIFLKCKLKDSICPTCSEKLMPMNKTDPPYTFWREEIIKYVRGNSPCN
ncbi:hypothetical protein [Desulforegula conservatrix]|uniref:hypothetical protein n=1 Tax=Desulforegula conservatrix TaxID=153026 RepID=UPI0004184F76|nr:hypothetical protein [Desulforegula conservatrix]